MKIRVKSDDVNLFIPFPTGLIFNRLTVSIGWKYLKQYGVPGDKKAAYAFVKALNRYRRTHPEWVLVEVESADGEYVQVKL